MEKYCEILQLSYKKFRFELHHQARDLLCEIKEKEPERVGLTKEDFKKLTVNISLPNLKEKAYKFLGIPSVKGEKIRDTIQKAYLMLAIRDLGWAQSVVEPLQTEHLALVDKIFAGEEIEGVDKDPFEGLTVIDVEEYPENDSKEGENEHK